MRAIIMVMLISIPSISNAAGILIGKDISGQKRQAEYRCIQESPNISWNDLRECIRKKMGKSIITINKPFTEDSGKK